MINTSFVHRTSGLLPIFYPDYESVHYELNHLHNGEQLKHFFDGLDNYVDQKREKVVITHIGDSHIQADFLTHTSRKLFQKTFGNGGRGFVFPFRLIRSNSPLNLKIRHKGQWEGCRSILSRDECNFGITGATATTFDSLASIKIDPNIDGDMNYEFNRIKLFSYRTPLSFDVRMLNQDSSLLDFDHQPIGPSVSQINFDQMQDSLWMGFNKTTDEGYFQLFGMSLENNNPGLVYNAIGLNGAYAKSYLRNNFFEEQMTELNSDLVILSLGTNDAYMSERMFCTACFTDAYRSLLNKIVKANPKASILLTTPGDFYIKRRYHNSNIDKVVKAIYNLAKEFDAAVWDFNKLMGGNYAIRKWKTDGLARGDLIHYSEEGYILQGKLLYSSIMEAYEKRFE
ncbi:MAG: hypothetical protein JJ975_12625 [Bacteroidia bacterium]|nr:hypothetical protein [Bacteroidia bacterium]